MFWQPDPKWSKILGLFGTCSRCGWETTEREPDTAGPSGYTQTGEYVRKRQQASLRAAFRRAMS